MLSAEMISFDRVLVSASKTGLLTPRRQNMDQTVDCWIRALKGSSSVTTLWVWVRPTCVLTTGLAVAQDAAARSVSSATDMSQVTLLWVPCSAKGNTCTPGGQHHMLGATRTLHETLNAIWLSPASQRPKKILASAGYIFLCREHWKYNQPSWSRRTLKISWQDNSDKVTNFSVL